MFPDADSRFNDPILDQFFKGLTEELTETLESGGVGEALAVDDEERGAVDSSEDTRLPIEAILVPATIKCHVVNLSLNTHAHCTHRHVQQSAKTETNK